MVIHTAVCKDFVFDLHSLFRIWPSFKFKRPYEIQIIISKGQKSNINITIGSYIE